MHPTLEDLLAVIDGCNAEDPNIIELRGERGPKELLHGRAMDDWVQRLDPDATVAQRLAARAHHLRRWTRPRNEFPEGRAGYLRWRTAARHAQAEEVRALLADAGIDDAVLDDVTAIVDKRAAGREQHVQTHEDALCLVFLEVQLDDVAERLGDEALVGVVAKTLAKMSPTAVAIARGLPLSSRGKTILDQAVRANSAG